MILNPEDMPYTKDGIIPDLVVNPYAYTKRMTVGGLLEILNGRLGLEMGFIGLGSPFEPINPEKIGDILEKECGITKYCDSVLYEGTQGKMMDANIYMGPVYYQRLKQQVQDKLNARSGGKRTDDDIPEPGGAYTALERQTVGGRANGGGMRLGEMERDSLIAHGVTGFIQESLMVRGDKFIIYVSKKTHNIIIINPENDFDQKVFFNPKVDGPVIYHLTEGEEEGYSNKQDILGLDTLYQSDTNFYKLEIPYCMKLLIQELAGMNMTINIKIEDITIQLGELFKSQKLNSLKDRIEIKETQNIIKKHNKSIQSEGKKYSKQTKSLKINKSMKGGGNSNLINELEVKSENIKEGSELSNDAGLNASHNEMNGNNAEIKTVLIDEGQSGGGGNDTNDTDNNQHNSGEDLKNIQEEFEGINITALNNELSTAELTENNNTNPTNPTNPTSSSNEFKIIDLDNVNGNETI